MDNIYEALLEHDLNPFLIFDSNGKLTKYNQEAEYLLNFTTVNELFELAVANASKSFGFNQKYVSLKYSKLLFYAILVGYLNDDEIVLRLYKTVSNKHNDINKNKLELVNIFSLIDISKNSTLLSSNLAIDELYDVSIPDIKIDIHNFLLCLNECFLYFKDDESISLKVYIKIGEYEIIDNTKYKIVALEFISSDKVDITEDMERKANKANINIFTSYNKLILELPLIL